MKRVVLTFLSAAAVCAALSATPAAAQDTVTGAPVGEAPVTVEGYGSSSGYPGPSSASAIAAAKSALNSAIAAPERCQVIRDFNDAEARDTVVCGP